MDRYGSSWYWSAHFCPKFYPSPSWKFGPELHQVPIRSMDVTLPYEHTKRAGELGRQKDVQLPHFISIHMIFTSSFLIFIGFDSVIWPIFPHPCKMAVQDAISAFRTLVRPRTETSSSSKRLFSRCNAAWKLLICSTFSVYSAFSCLNVAAVLFFKSQNLVEFPKSSTVGIPTSTSSFAESICTCSASGACVLRSFSKAWASFRKSRTDTVDLNLPIQDNQLNMKVEVLQLQASCANLSPFLAWLKTTPSFACRSAMIHCGKPSKLATGSERWSQSQLATQLFSFALPFNTLTLGHKTLSIEWVRMFKKKILSETSLEIYFCMAFSRRPFNVQPMEVSTCNWFRVDSHQKSPWFWLVNDH